jgi:hypothetical protein
LKSNINRNSFDFVDFTEPAQATASCPRQFALFGLGDSANCGQYISCDHGTAHTLPCPEDLAFSDETARCEWPDEVPSCDAAGKNHSAFSYKVVN